jgi:alpha-L-fucosidase 2
MNRAIGIKMKTRRDMLKAAALGALTPFLPGDRREAQVPAEVGGDLRLWYRRPAPDWNEALPIGNGRLGAMIFGGIENEHLQLNEDTLYSDEPGRRDLDLDITPDFDAVVQMLREGKFNEAAGVITKKWLGRAQPCYQPLGDLRIEFQHSGAVTEYERDLNLSTATGTVRYQCGGITFTREIFASHPDQVIVIRLTSNVPAKLNMRTTLNSVHPATVLAAASSHGIRLTGQAPGFALRRTLEWIEQRNDQWKYPEIWDKEGKRRTNAATVLYGEDIGGLGTFFQVNLQVAATDGEVTADRDGLHIRAAREAVLLISAATSYNGFKKSPSREGLTPSIRAEADIAAAAAKKYPALRNAHIKDYRLLFDRVSLDVGGATEQSRLPTDERIEQFANGKDPSLVALYFQFGRYLMIAGSRPGTQPLNLQGIWNPMVIPPWAGAYTTNINAEMNYWPAEMTNLSECHEPLLRMISELSVTGKEVAQRMYHRRGWVVHHNTTIWRDAQPIDYTAMPSFWPMAGGWLCRHLWEHYLFTGDRRFLEQAYPQMRGAAEFYCDWLVDGGGGELVTPAGNSPENLFQYADENGKQQTAGICMGPTMDLAIIRELFANCIRAAELLGRDAELQQELKTKLEKIRPYRIGSRGQLLEWSHDFGEQDPVHRHISHLYPLHPGDQITQRSKPELLAAARKTLELRGDEGTGWSRAWKINFWARIEDGNHAYKLVRNLLQPARSGPGSYDRGGVMPNLLCSHPPFQIDGNFGGAAGIAEMLLQSHAGEVHLLPALPDAWPAGSVRGLCARGGFAVDMMWRESRLTTATILSRLGGLCRVRYGERIITLKTQKGRTYKLNQATMKSTKPFS